jgi:hypothetical protein
MLINGYIDTQNSRESSIFLQNNVQNKSKQIKIQRVRRYVYTPKKVNDFLCNAEFRYKKKEDKKTHKKNWFFNASLTLKYTQKHSCV